MTFEIISAVLAYLLGSIPTAVWYGKIFHGIDIRDFGSGNAGATNSLRTLGKKAGIIVLIIDFLKGMLAVTLFSMIYPQIQEWSILLSGVLVILGHIFPIFAQFRGGKGVATAMGVLVGLMPMAALGCFIVFLLIVLLTKYVSLGSIIGALAFPLQITFIYATDNYPLIVFSWVVFLILTIMHRQNIKRLLSGTENKLGTKK